MTNILWLAADRDMLSIASDFAQAATGLIAAGASIFYVTQRCARRNKLQSYLLEERRLAESGADGIGARSIIHLMGHCSMTEAQVLEAAFGNKNIKTWVITGKDGMRATGLIFQINDAAWRKLGKSN